MAAASHRRVKVTTLLDRQPPTCQVTTFLERQATDLISHNFFGAPTPPIYLAKFRCRFATDCSR